MAAPRSLPSWLLMAIAVAIWSTTWHAILYQLAHTPPEASVAIRFSLAGALALGIAHWRGDRLHCSRAEHLRMALQGAFMYSVSYICVYHAERQIPSGLVAVGFSVSPLLFGVAARLIWRQPLLPGFLVGGVLCIAGVALIYAPEFAAVTPGSNARLGVAFTVGAVVLSAVGTLAASRNAVHRMPFWTTIAWGMLYSALLSGTVAFAVGPSWRAPSMQDAPAWWLSLAYLAVAGSLLAFACYLKVQERIGPGPAATTGVMTPVLALVVSALFEGFRPVALTWVGVALAVTGNVLILRPTFQRATASAGT